MTASQVGMLRDTDFGEMDDSVKLNALRLAEEDETKWLLIIKMLLPNEKELHEFLGTLDQALLKKMGVSSAFYRAIVTAKMKASKKRKCFELWCFPSHLSPLT